MSMPFDAEARPFCHFCLVAGFLLIFPRATCSQTVAEPEINNKQEVLRTEVMKAGPQLYVSNEEPTGGGVVNEYRIGPNDVVEINVFEAPEFNRKLRVAAGGEISVPLLGTAHSGGLTARQLEAALESQLRAYMKDPHVGVFVSTVESHPVSVLGAVKKPGVFQVRGPKSVLEMLSMAEGLADDAGDAVLVMRGASANWEASSKDGNQAGWGNSSQLYTGASGSDLRGGASASDHEQTIRINLKNLLQSEDSQLNVPVYPGDIVKVVRAGVVYVVGEVKKPGGFVLRSNENITVLQALALAEGLTRTSLKSQARIIRTDQSTNKRTEIPVDLGKILASKASDPLLQPKDIIFVPDSSAKSAFYRGAEAVVSTATGVAVYRW